MVRMNTVLFLRRNVLQTLVLRLLGKDIHFCKSHLASLRIRITESSPAVIQQQPGGSAHSWGLVPSACCGAGNIPHLHRQHRAEGLHHSPDINP